MTNEQKACRVLTRCRGLAKAAAENYVRQLQPVEVDGLAAVHEMLALPQPPSNLGVLLQKLIDMIEDRLHPPPAALSPDKVPREMVLAAAGAEPPIAEAATSEPPAAALVATHSPDGFPDTDG